MPRLQEDEETVLARARRQGFDTFRRLETQVEEDGDWLAISRVIRPASDSGAADHLTMAQSSSTWSKVPETIMKPPKKDGSALQYWPTEGTATGPASDTAGTSCASSIPERGMGVGTGIGTAGRGRGYIRAEAAGLANSAGANGESPGTAGNVASPPDSFAPETSALLDQGYRAIIGQNEQTLTLAEIATHGTDDSAMPHPVIQPEPFLRSENASPRETQRSEATRFIPVPAQDASAAQAGAEAATASWQIGPLPELVDASGQESTEPPASLATAAGPEASRHDVDESSSAQAVPGAPRPVTETSLAMGVAPREPSRDDVRPDSSTGCLPPAAEASVRAEPSLTQRRMPPLAPSWTSQPGNVSRMVEKFRRLAEQEEKSQEEKSSPRWPGSVEPKVEPVVEPEPEGTPLARADSSGGESAQAFLLAEAQIKEQGPVDRSDLDQIVDDYCVPSDSPTVICPPLVASDLPVPSSSPGTSPTHSPRPNPKITAEELQQLLAEEGMAGQQEEVAAARRTSEVDQDKTVTSELSNGDSINGAEEERSERSVRAQAGPCGGRSGGTGSTGTGPCGGGSTGSGSSEPGLCGREMHGTGSSGASAEGVAESSHSVESLQLLLTMDPPRWVPNRGSKCCMHCGMRFKHFFGSRHHCRLCGGLFCSPCVSSFAFLPPKFQLLGPRRVCPPCYRRLKPLQSPHPTTDQMQTKRLI